METAFQPIGFSPGLLIKDKITFFSGTAVSFLSNLAGCFRKKEDRNLAYSIIQKAEELAPEAGILDRHFLYQTKIQTYYSFRDLDDFALPLAIEACEQQMDMSRDAADAFKRQYGEHLPGHVGCRHIRSSRRGRSLPRGADQDQPVPAHAPSLPPRLPMKPPLTSDSSGGWRARHPACLAAPSSDEISCFVSVPGCPYLDYVVPHLSSWAAKPKRLPALTRIAFTNFKRAGRKAGPMYTWPIIL